ncbi:MAG: hypothetical protein KAQ94_00960 [Arcobacteraceae bacterium]|nr:hypothetical protein [Arcobacteraceae bacterium]
MRIIVASLIFSSLIFADNYSFDMDEIEVKTYEYSGYLKAEHKHQQTKNNDTLNSTYGEAQLSFKYFKDDYSLNSEFQANHNNINNEEKNIYTVNQLFFNYKASSNDSFNLGKKSLKWGKGYFFNPIAFLDRKKDPNNPEASKEGYLFANYKYNKSYDGDLKNFSFDIVYMPTSNNTNEDYYNQSSNNIALKSYFLYLDTDIDIIYLFNNKLKDKIGIDFSKNIETNFEIHGEMAKQLNGYKSYLFGIKYLTAGDLTITSEYFYQSEQLSKTNPFYDNKYFINKFSQKEPFEIVYSSVYYKNSLNLRDNSFQNSLGITYSFKNNFELDISYNKNKGNATSEFGSKLISDTIWTKVSWYF